MTKRPAWYGGNKIPDSHLKRFSGNICSETTGISVELKSFLYNMGIEEHEQGIQIRTELDEGRGN